MSLVKLKLKYPIISLITEYVDVTPEKAEEILKASLKEQAKFIIEADNDRHYTERRY